MSGFDIEPNAVQQSLRAAAFDFAEAEIRPSLADRDVEGGESAASWRPLWQKCADHGLLRVHVPVECGGAGLDVRTAIHVLEAFGEGCGDNGLSLGLNAQLWAILAPILAFGTDEQKDALVQPMTDGRMVAAFAMTEAESGSDAASMSATAKRVGGGYRLNGVKCHVGMGPDCDLALVFASTEPDHGAWGISAFLVDRAQATGVKGLHTAKMGLRTSPYGELHFDDCFVAEDQRLGPEGAGNSIFQYAMEWERLFIFSSHVGNMARQLNACTAHARDRKTFGKPLIEHQTVSKRLAEMRLRLETCRLLLHRGAYLKDIGRSVPQEAAMTKLHISEALTASSIDAMRLFGARGYMGGSDQERDVRDTLGGLIYSGASDIQTQIITRLLD